MFTFFETILCKDGRCCHLEYHQKRVDRTALWLNIESIQLHSVIKPPQKGLYRCRFFYDKSAYKVDFLPLKTRSIGTLKTVFCDEIEYNFKSTDREELDRLYALRESADDVLIVKDGYVCDTTIANVAFLHKNEWLTPSTPLLEGTTRARLLDDNFIKEADICLKDVTRYSKIAVMNALVGFLEVKGGIIFKK